jgi:hypothetical protein
MKKLIFILLAVGLPLGVATLANPAGLTLAGWPAMTALALGAFGIQWLAFIPARLFQTERFYDLTGSITYIAVTLAAISAATAPSGAQWLIAIMIFPLGRATRQLFVPPHHAAGGDQRFDHIKVSSSRFFVAWTLQGAWVVMTSCAALTAILSAEPNSGWRYLCHRRCDVGGRLCYRSHGRSAKVALQGRPSQRWSIHQCWVVGSLPPPNYFGEICCGPALR